MTDKNSIVFTYNLKQNIDELRGLDFSSMPNLRVAYTTTSNTRIYLSLVEGRLKLIPMVLDNNVWRELYSHEKRVPDVDRSVLSSLSDLEDFMKKVMVKQFRDAPTSYYDNLLSYRQILDSLSDGDTVSTMKSLRYPVYSAEVQDDPEWDGAISTACEEGFVLIPYIECDDGEQELVLKYATIVYDSIWTKIACKFSDLSTNVRGVLSNLHWSRFRNFLNELGAEKD